MKIGKLLELMYNYSQSLNDEILFYDSDNNELELFDMEGNKEEIVIVFKQKSRTTEVSK